MQMPVGGDEKSVEIFGLPIPRIRLGQASKALHKDSGKQMLLCWQILARWEGRRKTGEYFDVSSQLEVGFLSFFLFSERSTGISRLFIWKNSHPSWTIVMLTFCRVIVEQNLKLILIIL